MTLNSAPKNVNADYWCNLAIRLMERIDLQLSDPLRLTKPFKRILSLFAQYFAQTEPGLHKTKCKMNLESVLTEKVV